MKALLALAFLPLAACATTGDAPAVPVHGAGKCNNDALAGFIGRKADAAVGAEILAASGARTLRWGAPGMAMTMDYREDRLTVSYDEAMTITSARCG